MNPHKPSQNGSVMDIRPQDLPELRAELIAFYGKPMVVDWWRTRPTAPALKITNSESGYSGAVNPSGDQRRLNEIQRLESAELFFVAAPMAELAMAASASMPAFDLDAEDLPSLTGLIIFEQPIAIDANSEGSGEPMFISGASWELGRAKAGGQRGPELLWFSFYVDIYRTWNHEVSNGAMTRAEAARQMGAQPRYAYTMDAAHLPGRPVSNDDSVLNSWGRVILTAWLLMQQSLADVSEVEPDRAARKRLRREGHEPAAVRVIELRRPKHSGSEPAESSRNYVHRWITRGHWRQQWYPSREVHRPVWIAPHVKGPEGAPMIGGEKVYAWKR